MSVPPERTLGSYRLLERIGKGGMGEVYRAQHLKLGREAAVKVLPPALAHEADFLKRFEREAASAASLQHPNILAVWEYGEQGGVPYLVMPLIKGGTLKDRLESGILSREALVGYLRQVADALDYAHERGLVHRDVKPANLLLDERGHLYLADFGIAKALEGTEGLTGTGVGVGTPEYMAPEQAQGRADPRSDLYALGVILYQMLTGRVPYSGGSAIEVLMKHIHEPLPPLPRHNAAVGLPAAVEPVLHKALAKEPDQRYQTARALVEDVTRALATGPGAATVTTGSSQERTVVVGTPPVGAGRRGGRSTPLLLAGLLGLVVLMLGGGGIFALTWGGGNTPPPVPASATPTAAVVAVATASPTAPPTAPSPTLPNSTPTAAPTVAPSPTPEATATATAAPSPTPPATPTATAMPTRPPPAPTSTATVAPPPGARLRPAVERALGALPGTTSAIFVGDDLVVSRDADRQLPAASVIKLFVAGTVYQQVAAGSLQLTEPFTVRPADVVGGTGILQRQVGSTHTLDEMVEIMLLHSDNTASNMLIDRLGGFTPVNRFCDGLALSTTRLNRKLLDTAAQERGIENLSTARDVATYLIRLSQGQVVNRTYSQRILSILERRGQTDRVWQLRDLPPDVGAAHITGTLTGIRNDTARVAAGSGSYILVIFVQNRDEAASESSIARAGADIYRAVTDS